MLQLMDLFHLSTCNFFYPILFIELDYLRQYEAYMLQLYNNKKGIAAHVSTIILWTNQGIQGWTLNVKAAVSVLHIESGPKELSNTAEV